jgi:hypothetical protein
MLDPQWFADCNDDCPANGVGPSIVKGSLAN